MPKPRLTQETVDNELLVVKNTTQGKKDVTAKELVKRVKSPTNIDPMRMLKDKAYREMILKESQ